MPIRSAESGRKAGGATGIASPRRQYLSREVGNAFYANFHFHLRHLRFDHSSRFRVVKPSQECRDCRVVNMSEVSTCCSFVDLIMCSSRLVTNDKWECHVKCNVIVVREWLAVLRESKAEEEEAWDGIKQRRSNRG